MAFQNHSIIIDSRKKLNISGVNDVESFDEETVLLKTVMGDITIKGENLRIISFNTETSDLSAEGHIHAVVYMSEVKKSGGLISRIFR
ncbi:MAG: sporulation protein YabP [Clostridia bacterium]|nr:sporulation protein YabP [Clostridia bacterium]